MIYVINRVINHDKLQSNLRAKQVKCHINTPCPIIPQLSLCLLHVDNVKKKKKIWEIIRYVGNFYRTYSFQSFIADLSILFFFFQSRSLYLEYVSLLLFIASCVLIRKQTRETGKQLWFIHSTICRDPRCVAWFMTIFSCVPFRLQLDNVSALVNWLL